MVNAFIQAIRDEKRGFKLDQPWQLEEGSLFAIVPIIRVTKAGRSYITFAEANAVKVEDTGQIDYVYVESSEKEPIFISRGDIFRGKTQERAAIHGHIVMPNSALRVAVRCIHASRGINTQADMGYGGKTPYPVTDSLSRGQSQTWESVTAYSCNVSGLVGTGSPAPTMDAAFASAAPDFRRMGSDDLSGTLENLSDAIKEAMKKIPYIENQAGAIFFKENSVAGLDVYDIPVSWDAVKKDVVEKEGAAFLDKDKPKIFEFKPEAACNLVKERLKEPFEEKVLWSDGYKIIEVRGNNLIGEATEFKNKVIHLTLWAQS